MSFLFIKLNDMCELRHITDILRVFKRVLTGNLQMTPHILGGKLKNLLKELLDRFSDNVNPGFINP